MISLRQADAGDYGSVPKSGEKWDKSVQEDEREMKGF